MCDEWCQMWHKKTFNENQLTIFIHLIHFFKAMKKLMYLAAMAAFALASCGPEPTPEPIAPIFPDAPKAEEVTLTASPEGNPAEAEDAALLLTMEVEAEGAWKIEAADEYDWITVTPESGEGNATLLFVVAGNETDKDRIAEFDVKETLVATNADQVDNGEATEKEVKTYSILVNQVKKESNMADGALAFLKAIVEGNMMGEATPVVDNWYVVDESFPGITFEGVDGGKQDIVRIDGVPFTDLPAVMNLPILNHFAINNNPNLTGKVLPAEWNTPELVYCNFAACGLTGTIPAGFAETTPKMHTAFINTNYFYGAWPHTWAAGVNGGSGILECFISANVNNPAAGTELPVFQKDGAENDGMGYMVPATLDVKLNKYTDDDPSKGHANPSRDLTQIKLGGALTGQYVGFEKGWGQERYVKYGEGTADDLTTWNNHRLLIDEWAWYFTNVGHPDRVGATIPQVMLDWDQAAADAYTAEAKTKYGK